MLLVYVLCAMQNYGWCWCTVTVWWFKIFETLGQSRNLNVYEWEADAALRVLQWEDLDKDVWIICFPFSFLFNLLLPIGRSRKLAGKSEFIGRSYLAFNNEGTTLNINYYVKLNRSLPKCMTVCIESCGTGEMSSSILTSNYFAYGI